MRNGEAVSVSRMATLSTSRSVITTRREARDEHS
jgi:hypothetical protein